MYDSHSGEWVPGTEGEGKGGDVRRPETPTERDDSGDRKVTGAIEVPEDVGVRRQKSPTNPDRSLPI